jgi:phosphoribosylamine--glycine ligase
LLTRLDSDLLELLEATIDQQLAARTAKWKPDAAVCVVMASGGYPGKYPTGKTIEGLDCVNNATIFHAGTRLENGRTVTVGGRVLGVTALGKTLAAARDSAYAAVSQIHFENAHFRRDIAVKGLRP